MTNYSKCKPKIRGLWSEKIVKEGGGKLVCERYIFKRNGRVRKGSTRHKTIDVENEI